jgi:hypothetical protein
MLGLQQLGMVSRIAVELTIELGRFAAEKGIEPDIGRASLIALPLASFLNLCKP